MRFGDKSIKTKKKANPALLNLDLGTTTLVATGLVCLLILIFIMFARSYWSLREAILMERIDYVDEISAQIMTCQLFMEAEYSDTAVNLAKVIESAKVKSLDDIHEYMISKNKSDILLVGEDNQLSDLSGRQISMPDNSLRLKLMDNPRVTDLFTSINYTEDSWLFAAPFEPKQIGEMEYKAVVLCVSADEFRDKMTISLFDDLGASYIIGNDGRIKIKPHGESLAFDGFNLFSSIRDKGAPEEDVQKLESDLKAGVSGSQLIAAGNLDWLIGHTPMDEDTSIIVAIPLTLTAAETYEGLNNTIILSTLSVLIIALIAILFIMRFFRRDRQREKEALAVTAKSEFFSKMSHDIRTPLNAVIGLVQLAQDGTDDPVIKDYLAQSTSSANYLLSIINDVLDASRIESGKLTLNESAFDMNGLINDVKSVIAPLAKEKYINFDTDIDRPFTVMYIGDRVRIEQILTNLLSNSAKFTKADGFITLTISRAESKGDTDEVTFVVADTGIGMSEQFLNRIFLPFEQEKSSYIQQYAGTGLGLSIVHSLVNSMGGTIKATSKLGVGSAFTVVLPLKRGGSVEQETPASKSQVVKFTGKRILLAEDNQINQMVMTKILSGKFDIMSEIAPDGEIAVEMFDNRPIGTFDMILMDIKMPNMDGLDATRAIRALPRPDAKTIPIVALSANAFTEDVQLSLAAGMNDHLSKPLDIKALTDVFRKYFHQPATGGFKDEQ